MTRGPHSLLLEGSSCVLIAFLLQLVLSGAAEAFRWFWVPPYKELKSHTDENIQALPAEWSSRRTGDTVLSYTKCLKKFTTFIEKRRTPAPLGQTTRLGQAHWKAVVPELDRLHVLLPEPLQLCSHGLVPVPESLAVLLGRLWLRDLDPG